MLCQHVYLLQRGDLSFPDEPPFSHICLCTCVSVRLQRDIKSYIVAVKWKVSVSKMSEKLPDCQEKQLGAGARRYRPIGCERAKQNFKNTSIKLKLRDFNTETN